MNFNYKYCIAISFLKSNHFGENALKTRLLLFVVILLLTACGRKNEILPIVGKKSLIQQYGDGELMEVTLRFPLTESSIDAYEDVTTVNTPVLSGVFTSFNKLFYKMGTTFGMGKMKLRIHQAIPEIDPEYIKEMKITKIFFAVDDTICQKPDINYEQNEICRKKQKNVVNRTIFNFKKDKTNFDFVKSAILEMYPSDAILSDDNSTIVSSPTVMYSGFNDLLKKTFPTLFDDEIRLRRRRSKDEVRSEEQEIKEIKNECKIAGYEFNSSKIECSLERTKKAKKCINKGHVFIKGKCNKKLDANAYTDVDTDGEYEDVIFDNMQVKPVNIGRYYKGKEGVVIGSEYDNMILVKTSDSFNLRKFLQKNKKYEQHIQSMTSIKGVLFIELKNKMQDLRLFMEELPYEIESFEKNVKIDSVTSCLEGDCIALEINDVNLLDHLKDKNSVIIDTFLHVKDVPSKAFQLKGFVEFKVKFKLEF